MYQDYCFDDLIVAYQKSGVKKGGTVFIEADLACLGLYCASHPLDIVEAHVRALKQLVGETGTIVVPTFTTSFCNSGLVYDSDKTPSEMGMLSEYVRTLPESVRSFHPLTSYAAIGLNASNICKNTSYLAYGPESPMDRMIQRDAWFLSIGLRPYDTCSTVHQTELVMGVPYRYIKEFKISVASGENILSDKFYMHVRYNAAPLQKDKRPLFNFFEEQYDVLKADVGRGSIWGYSMKDFYSSSISYFKNAPYAILFSEPAKKPYSFTM